MVFEKGNIYSITFKARIDNYNFLTSDNLLHHENFLKILKEEHGQDRDQGTVPTASACVYNGDLVIPPLC